MDSDWEKAKPCIWGRKRKTGMERRDYLKKHPLEANFEDRVLEKYLDLDFETKICALKVSSSVVSLVSQTEEKGTVFACSGTIIGCDWQAEKGAFISTVLTSASLLLSRRQLKDGVPTLAHGPNRKVLVYLSDGMSYEAGDFQFNFHYNIAIVEFKSMTPYPTASLKSIDHSGPVIPKGQQHRDLKSSEPYPHCPTFVHDSNLFTICPGDKVVALGRHQSSHNLMASPGEFSFDCCDFDCGELLRASCLISINGIGGPLINCNGEVIGINFFHDLYTAFLPVNIVYKCVEHLNNRRKHLPWIGIKVKGLNVLRADKLENILLQYPDVSEGVVVEEVVLESPAKSSGICKNDVIVACSGKRVGSSSEFFGILLDKVGGSIDVSVARRDEKKCLRISIAVGDTSSDTGNRWPVPVKRRIT